MDLPDFPENFPPWDYQDEDVRNESVCSTVENSSESSFDDFEIINVEDELVDLPEQPPIVRSLSEHHWRVGEYAMVRQDLIILCVGIHGEWRYFISRENTKTKQAVRLTYRNDKVVRRDPIELPGARQCQAMTKQKRQCKKLSFFPHCSVHNEL